MTVVLTKLKVPKKAAERRRDLRDSLWPGAASIIWSRHTDDGYTTVPRTLPLIMTLINLLHKDVDASLVYMELWSRVSDEGFIEMTDESEHAYCAGYVTPRAARSFGERLRVLEKLGFIKVKPKGSWKYGYVLLVHPHDVVEVLVKNGGVPEEWRTLYLQRLVQTGARAGKPVKGQAKVVA